VAREVDLPPPSCLAHLQSSPSLNSARKASYFCFETSLPLMVYFSVLCSDIAVTEMKCSVQFESVFIISTAPTKPIRSRKIFLIARI
jgi:hypothetical protein